MSSIPSNLARVPNMLASQVILGTLNRTSQRLLHTQIQLSTGLAVNRPSDNPVAASTISVLDDIIERRDQRLRNLSHAEAVLNNIDAALGDANDLVLEAKGIGLSQIGIGSDAETRENQAEVIDALLRQLTNIGNRKFQQIHFFGGNATANPPITELLGQVHYNGQGNGINTDVGLSGAVPITMSAEAAFGTLSTRVQGDRDLDPDITASDRLLDLNGARGFGIDLGSFNVSVGATSLTVDLSNAHTVQNVIDTMNTAIQAIDPGASISLDPGGDGLAITTSGANVIKINDFDADATAADLGIAGLYLPGSTTTGGDLQTKLTEQTQLVSLTGVTLPLGTIRLENAGQVRDLNLAGANTVQDVINAVKGLNIGIRVEIADTEDRLNFVNELSGAQMSIGEFAGGTTATELGIRSFTNSTSLDDFNDGLGVEIRLGNVDPITGLPDPNADLDFQITLKDGQTIDVDLAGAATVNDVITAIRNARDALGIAPAQFDVKLAATGNGFEFTDNTAGTTFSITRLNGSFAAENLGILGTTTGATFTGEDRATVAVDSVFSHLISLRDALKANDERGIELATQQMEGDINRVAEARATVGVRTRRISDAVLREEDLRIQDMTLKSQVQDLDFTEAAVRFANLQVQLQAGLTTAAQATSLSLLDFLR